MTPLIDIARESAERFNLTIDDIKGRSRKGIIAKARIQFYIFAVNAGYTREDVGDFVGRGHSTVTQLYNRHEKGYGRYKTPWKCKQKEYKWIKI